VLKQRVAAAGTTVDRIALAIEGRGQVWGRSGQVSSLGDRRAEASGDAVQADDRRGAPGRMVRGLLGDQQSAGLSPCCSGDDHLRDQ
jgi:hypothetical protein